MSEKAGISAGRAAYLAEQKRTKIKIYSWRIFLLVALIALWEIGAELGWIDSFIMSRPSRIFNTVSNLYSDGELFLHLGTTCLETVIGFLIGTLAGTLIAILLWWSEFLRTMLEPYLVVLMALPKIALGPIFIVWVGAGPEAIVVMSLAISLIVTILEVLAGFVSTEEEKMTLMKTLGANKVQTFCKVVLPANLPTIMNSLKVNVGLSWVGVIVGEFLVSQAGIGYLIVYGSQVFKMDLVMASVVLLAIAAAVMYQGIVLIERVLLKKRLK